MPKASSKIFIAYENSDSFSAVSKFDGFPASQISDPAATETVSFSGFWQEQSWGHAVTAANGVDMIIVSLSGHEDLPAPVRRWMENLPAYEQHNHNTLVVLLGNDPADGSRQNGLISYFQEIAANHGLDFLCRCDGVKNFQPSAPALEPPVQREIVRNSFPAERPQAFDLLTAPLVS
jgi:hypothetical protein